MQYLNEHNLYNAFEYLRNDIPRLSHILNLNKQKDIDAWAAIINTKLLTRLSQDFPITATVCGGGSSGKSTLFNSLAGKNISPVGGSAGMNRRILVAAGHKLFNKKDFLSSIFQPFGSLPEKLKDSRDLMTPGPPCYTTGHNIPDNIVLMDTPDFDTGLKGAYTNRSAARQALEASDIFIYIFTNSNYNNLENTNFISKMLTGIGIRKCFLVYRVYPSFDKKEVLDHAVTVARNLYGKQFRQYVLGIYRADENNDVAAGKQLLNLRPVNNENSSFIGALQGVDSQTIRLELLQSIMDDVVDVAKKIHHSGSISRDELKFYRDTFLMAQSICAKKALQHFPVDRVIRRFTKIWTSKDPGYIKFMRKTGNIVDMPFKLLLRTAKSLKNKVSGDATGLPSQNSEEIIKEDLIGALNRIQNIATESVISATSNMKDPKAGQMLERLNRIRSAKHANNDQNPRVERKRSEGTLKFFIDIHPALFKEQEKLRSRNFQSIVKAVLLNRNIIDGFSTSIERELDDLAHKFRQKMGLWNKMRQTFSAFLNVVPATVAVTYVLSTGDPVGATGIKVKLTGLFGLHDLYALIAIPATTGLKKADRKQIEAMLVPIFQAWLNNKFIEICSLFEEEITGGIILTAKTAIKDSGEMLEKIAKHIDIIEKKVK